MASRLAQKKPPQTKQTNKKPTNIKLEFLKYPSNTSFIARLVSNLPLQQTHVHRHKLTHAAWPLHWLSLKIKNLEPTDLTVTPTFLQAGSRKGGRTLCVCAGMQRAGKNTVSLDPTDCRNGRAPLSTATFVTPACQPLPGYWHHHFKSIHNTFQIYKTVILQQLWLLA